MLPVVMVSPGKASQKPGCTFTEKVMALGSGEAWQWESMQGPMHQAPDGGVGPLFCPVVVFGARTPRGEVRGLCATIHEQKADDGKEVLGSHMGEVQLENETI